MLEDAYRLGEATGLAVRTQDEAGPFRTVPYPGGHWHPAGLPAHRPHEYVRNGTAKLLTLFPPAGGQVRGKGVTSGTNAILHPWLQGELAAILAALPPAPPRAPGANRAVWAAWQARLTTPLTLPADPPPLRAPLVLDKLAGHLTPSFVPWLFAHGVMPRYTPLGGRWLTMAESIQRVLKRRALEGPHPATPTDSIAALEATARGWNRDPTPFIWGGQRAARRDRARQRRHALGGSGAQTHRPVRRRAPRASQWR